MNNPVVHPDHYNWHPSGIECMVIVRAFNFPLGNVIKYAWRVGYHAKSLEDKLQDARKIRQYADEQIAMLEEEVRNNENKKAAAHLAYLTAFGKDGQITEPTCNCRHRTSDHTAGSNKQMPCTECACDNFEQRVEGE